LKSSGKCGFIGIDPGVSGAIGFVVGGSYAGVIDMPTYDISRTYTKKVKRVPGTNGPKTKTVKGLKKVYDYAKIIDIFSELVSSPARKVIGACVEIAKPQVAGRGRNLVRTAYQVGYGFGLWPLFLIGCNFGIGLLEVDPVVWKRKLSLIGKSKDDSRSLAKELLLSHNETWLDKKKDHNRAESLLLAKFMSDQYTS
jgi:hypothetical protein